MTESASMNQFSKKNPSPKDVTCICDLTSERSLQGCHIYLAAGKKELKNLRLKPARRAFCIYTLLFSNLPAISYLFILSFVPYLLNTQCQFLQSGPALVLSLPTCLSFPSVFFFCLVLFFFILLLLGSPKVHRAAWFAWSKSCLEQGLLMLAGCISLPLFSFHLQSKLTHFIPCF